MPGLKPSSTGLKCVYFKFFGDECARACGWKSRAVAYAFMFTSPNPVGASEVDNTAVPSIKLSGGECGSTPDPQSNMLYTPQFKTPNGRWAYQSQEDEKCWLYYDDGNTQCSEETVLKGWFVGCAEAPRSSGSPTDLVDRCSIELLFTEIPGTSPPTGTVLASWLWCETSGSRGEPVTFTVQSTSSLAYKAVQGKGCTSYIHMDHKVFGKNGGDYSLEECAAAVKKLDGLLGCKGNFFFFENAGYCNCPTDGCNTTPNNKAGGPGQLYEFTAGT